MQNAKLSQIRPMQEKAGRSLTTLSIYDNFFLFFHRCAVAVTIISNICMYVRLLNEEIFVVFSA